MTDLLKVTVKPSWHTLQARARAAHKKMLDQKRESVKRLGAHYVEYAREEAPKRSGKFARSLIYRSFVSGETVGFRVFSAQPLGTYITEGTRPHVIRARNAGVLYFFWAKGPKGPGMYAFKYVNHPGTQPNDFHARAMRRWRPEAIAEIRKISNQFVIGLKGGR